MAIALCIPITLIGISGSALLLQREILAASVPRAAATGEKQTIARIVAAAQAHAPPGMITDHVDLPTAEGASAVVQVGKPGQEQGKVAIYVDPVSLKILGSTSVVARLQFNLD
jgi:uncharacterized iron-regulated membrane protein